MGTQGRWGRFFGLALAMTAVSQVFHAIGAQVEMGYYRDPQYFPVWSKMMMPNAGPPPPSFFLLTFGLAFLGWALFLGVYRALRGGIPVQKPALRGLAFGAAIFFAGHLVQGLSMGFFINLPFGLLFLWALEALLIDLINGALAGQWDV